MLHELHVTDLGVIEDVDLMFHPGLNVLTGETGAGKTMITVALALALGRRASSALVREGARTARVQARFDPTPSALEEGWADEGGLVLARAIDADGRSGARAGGQITPVSVLERLAADLVEVHGQHESTMLRSAAAQTAFLDRFAGPEHLGRLDAYAAVHARLLAARAVLDDLVRSDRDREREADVLAFQIGEIESVAPRPGELAGLEAEVVLLANVERLLERTAKAERALSSDAGAADALAGAAAALGDVAAFDTSVSALAERARAVREDATELARDVRDRLEALDADPARLDEANARIAAVRGLLRKYGESEEGVLAFLEQARERAATIGTAGERRAALEREVDALGSEAAERAAAVGAGRADAAPRLAAAIEAEVQDLGMSGATLAITLAPTEPTAAGTERAAFVFSGGPRQRPLPLAKVASGGELSRTMLACRTVVIDGDAVPTLVFDEV
ncbi:MAG: AAA family ATPase, partial [Actinomycetota bacterium]